MVCSVLSANIYYQERMEEIKNKTNQTMIYEKHLQIPPQDQASMTRI
jgi:hypothetical protein